MPTEGESVGCRAALLVQNPAQDVNLIAGNRWAGRERVPLGRPGERPQGFGAPLILIGGVADGVEAAKLWTVMLAAYFLLVGVLNEAHDADCG